MDVTIMKPGVIAPKLICETNQNQACHRNSLTFAHSKYESDSKKRSKGFAGSMGKQGNCPDENVDADRSYEYFFASVLGQRTARTSSIFQREAFAKPNSAGTDEMNGHESLFLERR